jgi:hypothetical protein
MFGWNDFVLTMEAQRAQRLTELNFCFLVILVS